MNEPMYRAQILLRPEQHRKLVELSREEGRSISAIARNLIDDGLKRAQEKESVWVRRMKAFERLAAIRASIEARTGLIQRDLVEEGREEREEERRWR